MQGPVWRWFADDKLDCCEPLDSIKESGITIEQLVGCCMFSCPRAYIVDYTDPALAFRDFSTRDFHRLK